MSIVPKIEFTTRYKCRQIYEFLCYNKFVKEAIKLDDGFRWSSVKIIDIKKFFKTIQLPSEIKHKVFLILNNKACFFRNIVDMPDTISRNVENKYLGFNLLEGEI